VHLVELQPRLVGKSALTALKAASTGPSPVAVTWWSVPSTVSVRSADCGASVPQITRRNFTSRCGRPAPRLGRGIGHQRDQVVVEDLLLAVGQRLEPHEDVVQLVVGQLVAQILQLRAQRRAARMLAHHGRFDSAGRHPRAA
jgi:hypothetical protein